jgi:hypothetical protein
MTKPEDNNVDKKAYKDPNFLGLNTDQMKLLFINLASFAVSTAFLLYYGNRDGTIKSNWIFLLYVIVAIASYYLYYSMII